MPTTASRTSLLTRMPEHSRVWVYKSAVPFSAEQIDMVQELGEAFAGSWTVHGAPLAAAVDVLHGRFVVLAVDERQAAASGCSIDSSVHFIQRTEQAIGLSLTDRMVVLYEQEDGIHACRATEVEQLLHRGTLTPDTLVYDDLVATVGDLATRFKVPLRSTWLARYC